MGDILSKLKQQKKILESEGYKVAFITLYGSQNYRLNLDNDKYKSDVDMKAIIVPSLDELIKNSKPVSKVVATEWGECDVKDIRNYFETLLKANPTYIETLFTEHYIVDKDFQDELNTIYSLREDLVKVLQAQFIRAMYGMMCEKEKALTHPYPSIAHKIEKYGYDGKQAHHILRMFLMMKDYFDLGKPLKECFYPTEEFIPYLINLKLNKLPLEEVKEFVGETMAEAKDFRESILSQIDGINIDYSIKDRFTKLSQEIIKKKIVKQIRGESNS